MQPIKLHKTIRQAFEKGYRVTFEGQVLSPSGHNLTLTADKEGYPRLSVRVDGHRETFRAYRLAAYQKFGEESLRLGVQVRHLNGKASDTSLDNIALGSPSQNQMDKPAFVRKRIAGNAAAKQRSLTQEEANQLRKDREEGATYSQLTKKYGLAKSTVSYIVNRKTYN